jgi:outer membrane biosynthesis protein TonB
MFVQAGVPAALLSQRPRAGFQLGQAILLASPLFEMGNRSEARGGREEIPLSALVPERKLVAPDLRRLQLQPLQPPERSPREDAAQAQDLAQSPSVLAAPLRGTGGALPGGVVAGQPGAGGAVPFDFVPPSNRATARQADQRLVRVLAGDASVPGGGAAEGLRLPPSPPALGASLEATVESGAAASVESYLILLLTRLRRACFEAFPPRRGFGPPGEVQLALVLERPGRLRMVETVTPSGNPELDRRAREAVSLIPAVEPLPQAYSGAQLRVVARLVYRPQ